MKSFVLLFIRLYQATLSPDYGWFQAKYPYGYCRFQPTCSQYGYEAVERYGVGRGGLLAVKRVLRCHPWSDGGIDPVPSLISHHHGRII